MLKFAHTYREAIDKITGERALKLRDYELLESEWETVKHLRDSLKVRTILFTFNSTVLILLSRYLKLSPSNSQPIHLALLLSFQQWTRCMRNSQRLWRM